MQNYYEYVALFVSAKILQKNVDFGKVAILLGKSRRWKKTSPIIRIFFEKKWSFGRKGKFLVFKSWMSESVVGFSIRRIFDHAHGHMLDLPRSPPWNVEFYLVESINFDQRFIKQVPLV